MARLPRLPRGKKIDSRGRTSRQRLNSIRGKRARRRFGEELLNQLGFSGSNFASGGFVKGKLGLFGGAISKSKPSRAGDVGGIPKLDSPKKESNQSNPTLSTIVDQLKLLIKSANKLGIISKEQQKTLLQSIIDTRNIDTEALIENKDSELTNIAGGSVSAESLLPLSTAIEQLADKLALLGGKVDQKIQESDNGLEGTFGSRFFDELGAGDIYESVQKRKRRNAARSARFASPENQRRLRIAARERRASRFKPEQLLDKRGKPLTNNALDWKLGALERARKQSSFSYKFTSGAKSALKRIAGPLLTRTLGRSAIKVIPVAGGLVAGGLVISKLLQGDVKGAGIELASNSAIPLVAIPALVSSITKDSYPLIYGMQPEQDPEAPKRLKELKQETEKLVGETISGQIQVQKKPTTQEIDRILIGDQPKQQTQQSKPSTPPVPIPTAPPTPKASSDSVPSSSDIVPTKDTSDKSSSSSKPKESEQSPPSVGSRIISKSTTGLSLAEKTKDVYRADVDKDDIVYLPSKSFSMPSTAPTTRPGANGMGDVRSPYYDFNEMGSIPSQVYY